MNLFGAAMASFSLCLLALLALRPVAIAVNLLDRPGGRKSHVGDVPVVGGLGMLLGISLGFSLLRLQGDITAIVLGASAVLVVVGLVDDRFDLSPWARLLAQTTAAVFLFFGAGAMVTELGEFFGQRLLLTGTSSAVFTILIIVAAVNAFNMLDGMDGLAGALAMVSLAALAYVAVLGGNLAALGVTVVLMGSVAAFLVSNLPFRATQVMRCFMGDSGSTLLGFVLAWLCISLSAGPGAAVSPVTMLWIVAMPLIELFWTVIRRSIRGIPPFRSDQGHLHHRALQAGVDVLGTFILFVVVAIVFATIGIVIDVLGVSDTWSLALLILCSGLFIRLVSSPALLRKLMPRSLKPMETAPTD